jgi:hypothetical protein
VQLVDDPHPLQDLGGALLQQAQAGRQRRLQVQGVVDHHPGKVPVADVHDPGLKQPPAQLLVGQFPEPGQGPVGEGGLRLFPVNIDEDGQPGKVELLGAGQQVGKFAHLADLASQGRVDRQPLPVVSYKQIGLDPVPGLHLGPAAVPQRNGQVLGPGQGLYPLVIREAAGRPSEPAGERSSHKANIVQGLSIIKCWEKVNRTGYLSLTNPSSCAIFTAEPTI